MPSLHPELSAAMADTATAVERMLDRLLPQVGGAESRLFEAMRYSALGGGKRLRPFLVMSSASLFNVNETCALRTAAAVECIHCYSLVHDDLPAMDNSDLRRGKPTVHKKYDEATAILAGDALLTLAFEILAGHDTHEDPKVRCQLVTELAKGAGAAGMVGGQAIDLQVAGQAPGGSQGALRLDADGLRDMHARKTGAMIRASAVAGAIMAGASDDLITTVDRYAAEIGLAFQIVDDILDVEGSAGELGKTAGKDAAEAKPTYAALYGVSRSRQLAAECAARAHQTLVDAGLTAGHLGPIVDWIITRKN